MPPSRLLKYLVLERFSWRLRVEESEVMGRDPRCIGGVWLRFCAHIDAPADSSVAARSLGTANEIVGDSSRTKNHSTKPRHDAGSWRKPPDGLHPAKGSSIRLRLIVLMR